MSLEEHLNPVNNGCDAPIKMLKYYMNSHTGSRIICDILHYVQTDSLLLRIRF